MEEEDTGVEVIIDGSRGYQQSRRPSMIEEDTGIEETIDDRRGHWSRGVRQQKKRSPE